MGNIAQNLIKFMDEAGLNIEELSRKSGVSSPYISQIRSGNRKKIGAPYLQRIARALGISVDSLVTGNRNNPSDYVCISDDEIRDFFAGDWNDLDESEKDWIRGAVRIAKDNLNKPKGA